MTMKELAVKVLKEGSTSMNAKEIWELAVRKGYHRLVDNNGKTPIATIRSTIYRSLKHDTDTPFKRPFFNPQKISLKSVPSKSKS